VVDFLTLFCYTAGQGGAGFLAMRHQAIPEPNAKGARVQVLVRDNNVDQALKALKKKMQREGLLPMKAKPAPTAGGARSGPPRAPRFG